MPKKQAWRHQTSFYYLNSIKPDSYFLEKLIFYFYFSFSHINKELEAKVLGMIV